MRVDKRKWVTKPISSFFDLQMGKTPSRKSLKLWENGDIPWVSISDMNGIRFISSTKEMLPAATIKQCNISIVPVGTVIMSFKLTIGKTCIANVPLTTNEAIMAFYPKKEVQIDNSFLCYALSAIKWKGNRAVKGITINKKTIYKKEISLPSFTEQQAIATELDAIQTMIDGYKAQIADLDVLAQSIFLEMFGDPVSNPKRWNMATLKSLCSHIVDCPHSTPQKSNFPTEYPCIRTSELTDSGIDWTSMQYLEEDEYKKRVARLKPQSGDLIYGREGSVGGCIMVPKEKHFCLGQRTMLFRPSKISPLYLLYAFRSPWIRHQAELKMVGQTVRHVNIKDIVEFTVPLTPFSLQQQFASKVEAIERQKELIRFQLKDAETLMAERMQYYFS